MNHKDDFSANCARLKSVVRRSHCAYRLRPLYRIPVLRRLVLKVVRRLEGGEMFSLTLRGILHESHGVAVGRYSYGSCLVPGLLPPGTQVGNYCSFATGLRVYRRDHPKMRISSHPFFYNPACGVVQADTIQKVEDNPLTIGHDVWIAADVIILSKCCSIGNGAIIGARSVVTRDVRPFTINAGSPAKVLGERFDAETRDFIQRTEWWNQPVQNLAKHLPLFTNSVSPEVVRALSHALPRMGEETRP